jgi:DNA-binding response OmpR family regulator
VDVHIFNLRQKLRLLRVGQMIESISGQGYRLLDIGMTAEND